MKEIIPEERACGLYVRVSTDAQVEDGFSIDAQQARLEGYCTAMGWTNYKFYIDGGCTGSNLERPQIEQLIEDVQAKKIQTIIVYKLDRLSRSQKDTLYLIEDVFMPNQVDFISVNESIDTSTPYGRAMIGILSAFAQLERENIFMRTRMGMLERVKRGYWMGGGATPFGYDYDSIQGTLIPNEDAGTVRKVFDLYISGYSTQRIASTLGFQNERTVCKILKRRTYVGVVPYNGEEYPGRHDAIISMKTYDLAQHKMLERSFAARATTHAEHLLSGMIWCGTCGTRLRYIRWGKAGYKLRCYSQDPSKTHMAKNEKCKHEAVWADQIEDIVLQDLFRISVDMERKGAKVLGVVNPLEELSKRILRGEAKLKRLYHLYGEAGDVSLLDAINELKGKQEKLHAEYEAEKAYSTTTKRYADIHRKISTIEESWPYLSAKERQEIVRDCVSRIVIYKGKIEIFYTFTEKTRKTKVA